MSSSTGAEKPRSSDGTGSAATSWNTSVVSASVSTTVWLPSNAGCAGSSRSGWSRPSGPTRPSRTGITNGSLTGCPGVAGQLCDSVSV